MSSQDVEVSHPWWRVLGPLLLLLLHLPCNSCGLSTDGMFLLSLKNTILADPLQVLQSWNSSDDTPCSWKGVTCTAARRVTCLSLPSSQLLGSLPSGLFLIQHLRNLDLSNNSFNGSLPSSLFNASELRFLDLSNNMIAGELPENVGAMTSLQVMNLSDNALAGSVPEKLTTLRNLTVVSLYNNYFAGGLLRGMKFIQVFDLSSNLINGTLPVNFEGGNLRYFNVSFNKLSGKIPPEFARKIPENATVDLSFNNLTGELPETNVFFNQAINAFSGNPDLCGKLLKNPCQIPSHPRNGTVNNTSPPAIAAIPNYSPDESTQNQQERKPGLRRVTIVGIVVGDLAGITIVALIFLYVYQIKRNRGEEGKVAKDDSSTGSDYEEEEEENPNQMQKKGSLVTVDGEKELELETLLKASAYILGAAGSSIMYKAVLEDGTVLAVRRIGESCLDRFKEFDNQVRAVAKLVHPNLVRIRGFYWGADEKLLIYDFVPNGSLANVRHRKTNSSPCHLPWEPRLKIAKGVARGLSYLHEKKHVHGNLKPANILLGPEMEPMIGDLGLDRFLAVDPTCKAGGSTRTFGSKRSTTSRDSFQDAAVMPSPSPSPSTMGCASPYHPPESLRSLKPSAKWDVYSFGMILLELITGKVMIMDDLGQALGLVGEDKSRISRIVDVAIKADVEGNEDAVSACFKLGFSCASPIPSKRPNMKEALHALEKISSSSTYDRS